MNATELKSRATRLAARLNAMGFTKDGKPLVVDQAYELVAAEEGHRNQHVLRAKLSATPALVIPPLLDEEFAKAVAVVHTLDDSEWAFASEAWELIVAEAAKRAGVPAVTDETERASERNWIDTVNRMGWNDRSEVLHLESFIRNKGLMGELAQYAATVAAEEDETSDVPAAAIIAALKTVGYLVTLSDFDRPFWAFGDEFSCDFDIESEAWTDAWGDAQKRTAAKAGVDRYVWAAKSDSERLALVVKTLGKSAEMLMREAANLAYENYDFGEHLTVADDSGWEWTGGSSLVVRSVFLEDDRAPRADTVRYRFTVEIVDGKVISTSLNK